MQHQSRRNLDDLLFLILKKNHLKFLSWKLFLGICAGNQCKCYVMGCFYWFFVEKSEKLEVSNTSCFLLAFRKQLSIPYAPYRWSLKRPWFLFDNLQHNRQILPRSKFNLLLSVRRPLGVFCESNCFQVLITRTFEKFHFVGNVGE